VAEDARIATVAGAVLLGGASTRMGHDKGNLEIDGLAGATRAARLLGSLFAEVLLVGGEAPADAPGVRVADPPGPACALRGLVGALEAATSTRVLVLATDLPLVTPALLLALVAWPESAVVAPRSETRTQPLCALYRRDAVLRAARDRLASRKLKLQGLLDAVDTAYLDPSVLARLDPGGHALFNVNTPDDLTRARELLRAQGRRPRSGP
jgi:molybdopterin-guanine dinucleotide biosynthesis protein A